MSSLNGQELYYAYIKCKTKKNGIFKYIRAELRAFNALYLSEFNNTNYNPDIIVDLRCVDSPYSISGKNSIRFNERNEMFENQKRINKVHDFNGTFLVREIDQATAQQQNNNNNNKRKLRYK